MVEDNSGLTAMNVSEMVRHLSGAYTALCRKSIAFRSFPSVMLWGPPGVGKSQGVREIAESVSDATGRHVEITDVRLLLFNPVDLRGIPTTNEDRTLAVWLKPKIFQMDESPDVVNFLFLDEISAAAQSIQAAAYQITLDRCVGEHKLPENCIVIAAGNRVTDKSVAYNMPKALANRLLHLEIKGDPVAWHGWALRKGIHPFVTGYLDYNPVALMRFDPTATSLAFPTPRSWEMASNILNTVSDEIGAVYPLLAGCVGREAAASLQTWAELYRTLPSAEEIFAGGAAEHPAEAERRIALRSALAAYARRHPERTGLDNSIAYACGLPWEFRSALLHDYACIPALVPLLRQNKTYQAALEHGLR